MEFPLQDIVNTSEDTMFVSALDPRASEPGLHTVMLDRSKNPREKWGFRLQGGKDRGIAFQLLQVPLNSVAGYAGCRTGDYLVKINGRDVFEMSHDEAKSIIASAKESLTMVIERGDHIVPSMNEAFPNHRKKQEAPTVSNANKPYYQRVLEERGELPGQQNKGFTTVGKPKMATKQFNSPLEIYGQEALDEIMDQGTLFGREIDPTNPWNAMGKTFEPAKSDVLSHINAQNGGGN